jgi:putative phosphoesterase
MKFAIIADIHGNRPALEAVVKAAPPVDGWICAGDVVGYYPDVNEVCGILLGLRVFVVRGNHDAYVINELMVNEDRRSVYRTDWTRQQLKPEYKRWIAAMPVEMVFRYGGTRLVVRHASPWDEETYLYPDSGRLAEIRLDLNEYLLLGHTHHPMCIASGEGFVINPGAVGQPRDYNPAASFAVLDLEAGTVENRRVEYDVVSYQQYLRNLEWPETTIAILSRTRQTADRCSPSAR